MNYMDTCSNSGANTCIKTRLVREGLYLLDKKPMRSNAVDLIVVDSVAALVPQAEIEGEMGDAHMGLQARLMSQALRKLTGNIKRSNTLVIFINQIINPL